MFALGALAPPPKFVERLFDAGGLRFGLRYADT